MVRLHDGSWRRLVVIVCTGLALVAMGAVFWQQDLRYSLPTPQPAGLVQAPAGQLIALPEALTAAFVRKPGQPLLLHFYNPDCPCSRFNRDHVQALLQRFGTRVQFVSVVEASEGVRADSDLPMPHVADHGGGIAKAFGVYATPQAVLLDAGQRLVFRGNYNTSRYCTARQTEFARLAIEALLDRTPIASDSAAEVAYGCQLPDQECRDDRR